MGQEGTYRKEYLTNGAIAYIIPRKSDPQKPSLIHFGFGYCTLAICGFCMCARLFPPDNNLRDVGQWCCRHWRSHDTAEYSDVELSKVICESIGVKNTRQNVGTGASCTPRNVLLPKSWLIDVFGEALVALIKREGAQQTQMTSLGNQPGPRYWPKTICNKCLTCKNLPGCCLSNRLIEMGRLQGGRGVQPIFFTQDETLLAEEAAIIASLSSLSTPSAILAPTMVSPLLSDRSPSDKVMIPCSDSQDQDGVVKVYHEIHGKAKEPLISSMTGPFHISVASLLLEHDQGRLSARETLERVRQLLNREQWGRKRIRVSIPIEAIFECKCMDPST